MTRRGLVLASALFAAAPAAAQNGAAPDSLAVRLLATRTELEAIASRAPAARTRLAAGDFQAGDRILLRVEGQPALSDTFTVDQNGAVVLPIGGAIPLRGVLRSELETYLSGRLAEFLKYPYVHAQGLIRISVQGAVARPGFYYVPAAGVLSDALMVAGGTSPLAKVDKIRLERAGAELAGGDELRRAMAAGRTFDAAYVLPGDEFVVPGERAGGTERNLRFVWLLVSLTGGIYGLTRIF